MAKIGCMLVSLYVLGISTKYSNADGFTSILEKGEMNYAVGVESAKNVGYHLSCEPTVHFQFYNMPLYPTISGFMAANSEVFAYAEYGGGVGLDYEIVDQFNFLLKTGIYSYTLSKMLVWGSIDSQEEYVGTYLKVGTKSFLSKKDWIGYSLEAMAKTRKPDGLTQEKISYQLNVGLFIKLNTPRNNAH